MNASKYIHRISVNKAYLTSRALMLIVIMAILFIAMYCLEKNSLMRTIEQIPQSYLMLLDRSVRHSDMVAECKASYTRDMTSSELKIDGQSPNYIIQAISRCDRLEAAMAKQKVGIDNFYSSDFYVRLKAGDELTYDEMNNESRSFRTTASDMEKALISYSHDEENYYNEKAAQQYKALKKGMGDTANDPQITSRFETIDLALETGNQRLFLNSYKELQAFLVKRQKPKI